MAITHITVGNFKGIDEVKSIPLRPITVFLGPNSSGKSTCIHALACLGQSVKITSNPSHLVLDDEFADVHLGRFKEVAHSRDSIHPITLGFRLSEIAVHAIEKKQNEYKVITSQENVNYEFQFKCKGRTQEPFIANGLISIGDLEFQIEQKSSKYFVKDVQNSISSECKIDSSLKIDLFGRLANRRKMNDNFYRLHSVQNQILSNITKILYLGPFRQAPLRLYPTRGGNPREVGPMGESTIPMLANETIQSRTRSHVTQISSWLSSLGLAKSMYITRVGTSDLFDMTLEIDKNIRIPIADLWYGVSQVLPVLTQCSFAPKDSTLLFEQPEIHLHTIAARRLANIFIETARTKNCNIILETHSPELFKEFLSIMRAGKWSLDDFVTYRVSRTGGKSILEEIDIDPDNFDTYDNWEKGISVP